MCCPSEIGDNTIEEYKIEILKVDKKENSLKNILFEIKDEELLEKTGGVVQGMSGSPIIQNGKLVGIVSHVTLENPAVGYAVYAEWMYNELVA